MLLKNQKLKWLLALCFSLLLVGCGGGGDSVAAPETTATNTCANLGLVSKSLDVTKIRNGTECVVSNLSPVVMLWLTGEDGRVGLCTGTMITTHTVLTAGHCATGRVAIDVFYGSAAGGYFVQRANAWSVHPGYAYTSTQLLNDVAVVYIPVDAPVQTLPILVSVTPKLGDIASIYGYGITGTAGNDSAVLRSGSSMITGITDQKIISVFDGTRSNTCSGDSGGPLTLTTAGQQGIIGVTSSGTVENCGAGDWSSSTRLQNGSIQNYLRTVAPDARFI